MIPVFSGEYAVIVGGGDVSDLLLPFVRGASMIIAADSALSSWSRTDLHRASSSVTSTRAAARLYAASEPQDAG